MTHFIGAVLVPATVANRMETQPTKYPDLYGKDAKEVIPGNKLNTYLDEALERFNENHEVSIWQPKADLIAEARKYIEEYRDSIYAEYLKDPVAYAAEYSNRPKHLEYLSSEFPAKLEWTDEQIYQNDILAHEDPKNVRESDGAIHTTYNPDSKWDWWTIGGRWEQTYRSRQGEKVSSLRAELRKALADMQDPEAQAELAAVEAHVRQVRLAFQAKILTYDDVEAAERKRIGCRAYMPWWFPYSLVTKDGALSKNAETNRLTGYEWHTAGRMGWWGMKSDDLTPVEWVEKLIRILADRDDNDFLVYIDFHI